MATRKSKLALPPETATHRAAAGAPRPQPPQRPRDTNDTYDWAAHQRWLDANADVIDWMKPRIAAIMRFISDTCGDRAPASSLTRAAYLVVAAEQLDTDSWHHWVGAPDRATDRTDWGADRDTAGDRDRDTDDADEETGDYRRGVELLTRARDRMLEHVTRNHVRIREPRIVDFFTALQELAFSGERTGSGGDFSHPAFVPRPRVRAVPRPPRRC